MSSGDADVICGPFSISWSSVVKVAEFLHKTALISYTFTTSRSYNVAVMQACGENPWPLLMLLRRARRFAATNPRDMLFALYGMVLPEERSLLDSPFFQISYEKPVKEVYRDAVIGYVMHYGLVEMMCEVSACEDHEGYMIEGLPFAIASELSQYDACGGLRVRIAQAENPDVLRLAGKCHDIVDWAAEPFEENDFQLLPHKWRPQTLEKLWGDALSRLGKSHQTCQAFWRTLIANVDRVREPVPENFYLHFLRYWHDSKFHDRPALEYMADNPTQPAPANESEEQSIREQTALETKESMTCEDFEAFKRYIEKLASRALPCTKPSGGDSQWKGSLVNTPELSQILASSDTDCRHCITLRIPELMLKNGTMRVDGPSPSLVFREIDPFISDFFDRLEDDDALITSDANTYYHSRLLDSLMKRTFFITKGGLMGIGQWNARLGDEVVIMTGSRVPFILRRSSAGNVLLDRNANNSRMVWNYRVVGDSYVHGIMNGEAVENFNWDTDYDVFDLV